MDTNLKRGLLEICVLKVLSENDSYGYSIIKALSDVIEISESTLYPILKRLEKNTLVESYSVTHNSRLRKYYKITNDGIQRIKDFLIEWNQVEHVIDFLKEEENE